MFLLKSAIVQILFLLILSAFILVLITINFFGLDENANKPYFPVTG